MIGRSLRKVGRRVVEPRVDDYVSSFFGDLDMRGERATQWANRILGLCSANCAFGPAFYRCIAEL